MCVQRARGHHGLPVVRMADFLQGRVVGGHVDRHRPGVRVARQGQQRETLERDEQPGQERRRLGPVLGPEVACVVDESGVFGCRGRLAGPDGGQPAGQRRPPSHGIDDQVGPEFSGVSQLHPRHARNARHRPLPVEQPGGMRAAADVQPIGGGAGHRVFDHRAAAGQRDELLVRLPRAAVGDERRHQAQHVEPPALSRGQRLVHAGQQRREQLAARGMQVMRLPELGHAGPVPVLPGAVG